MLRGFCFKWCVERQGGGPSCEWELCVLCGTGGLGVNCAFAVCVSCAVVFVFIAEKCGASTQTKGF